MGMETPGSIKPARVWLGTHTHTKTQTDRDTETRRQANRHTRSHTHTSIRVLLTMGAIMSDKTKGHREGTTICREHCPLGEMKQMGVYCF